jgi:hypothetical protein
MQHLYMNVHGSFIYNHPKLETTHMSFSEYIVKQTDTFTPWNTTQQLEGMNC